ncbi:ATP binding [Tubulinosema ratisbonensis]|uniref:GPN-loop GTPase 3 n=1 Tax=Tubulinosema ratisbonensis TaxID=291195 RepID=A0A437AM44_9MICR|nr:ATP binding [Tubulinosema ratisbonensis]
MGQALFVIGPAGSGKTTFCKNLTNHGKFINRSFKVINLDPANIFDDFHYYSDIREFITVDEVQENTDLGPNTSLLYALKEMYDNIEELELDTFQEDFLVFDCPGQIELFSHSEIINDILNYVSKFMKCSVIFVLDCFFISDPFKFVLGNMTGYLTALNFNVPRLNVLTKLDLFGKSIDVSEIGEIVKKNIFTKNKKYNGATLKMLEFLEENHSIDYFNLFWDDEESLHEFIYAIDTLTEYCEDAEPRINYPEEY